MREVNMKKVVLLLTAILMLCGCLGEYSLAVAGATSDVADPQDVAKLFKEKGYKIAYILNGTAHEIFKMSFEAAKREAQYYGMTVDVFTTDGDDLRFQDVVNQCAQQNYDGMFLSHGKAEYSYNLILPLVEKGIKIVTFDTVIEGPNGEGKIDGVTQTFQNDQEMAKLILDYTCDVLFKDLGRPVKVLKLWIGPGIAPCDRRQETYLKFEQAGKIETLEVLGPTNMADVEGSMASVVASVLPKYPEGKVDVIWSVAGSFSRGAYKAVVEADRNIPIVSIDVSNQDLNYMREDNGIWKACAAVHFETVGMSGIRLLAQKLNGDETPDTYILSPSLVVRDQLTPDATVLNLGNIVEGYGVNNDNILDWMRILRDKK